MKWYNKTWVIILFLIFFFPVGLILMWNKGCKWKTPVKVIVSALIGILFVSSLFGSNDTPTVTTMPKPTIVATTSPTPAPTTTIQPTLAPTPIPTAVPEIEVPQTVPVEDVSESSISTDETDEITVYVTNSGKKYHRSGCQYLSSSKIPISLEDAESEGYEPCSKCR